MCFIILIISFDIKWFWWLLDKKSYENISVYNTLYKSLTGRKPLRIGFDKIDGFITSFDGKTKYLMLFDYGLFNKICEKIKYLISTKSGIANSINHNTIEYQNWFI